MSLAEQVRSRVEEIRTRVRSRVEAIRGGTPGSILRGSSGSPVLGGNILGQGLPVVKEIREKGAISVLQERFPRLKEVRAAVPSVTPPAAPTPPSPPTPTKFLRS
jgi:hypothetical protein